MKNKKKIAITFPQLHEFGGGEIFCEYMANFLSKFYLVDLYYYKTKKINSKLRIKKNVNKISIKSNNKIFDFLCRKYIGFAQLYLVFILNKKKLNYNFIFSAAGEFYSKYYKVYQYIHHPFYSLNPFHFFALGIKRNQFIKIILRFFMSIIGRFYFGLLKYQSNIKNINISIVNSNWTKIRFKSIYKNNKVRLIYPTFLIPNYLKGFQKNFEKRKNDFVILGRVSEDKNTLVAVDFFLKLKLLSPKVGQLHVIGPYDSKMYEKLKLFHFKHKKKVIFHGYLSKKKRNQILRESKYGIHFARYEHFGRSVLEMHKNGLIVFAHNSGGSSEIMVDEIQKYSSIFDLEAKILEIISDSKKRHKLIKKYDNKFLKNFTDKKFQQEIKNTFIRKYD